MKKTITAMPKRAVEKKDTARTAWGDIERRIGSRYISPGVRGADTTYTSINTYKPGGSVSASSSGGPAYKYKELKSQFDAASAKKKR